METQMARTIGGYFQLSLGQGREYYPDLIKLNTSRNALEYILLIKGYTKVYLPYFTCEVMLEPLIRLNIEYQFYNINNELEPIFNFEVGATECLLYTNYFGLKQKTVKRLKENIKNLIIDNAQAFFSKPLKGIDTFYSCRKFFGVPDGAYLQIDKDERLLLEIDSSSDRFGHLIGSIDYGIEHNYADFLKNEEKLNHNNIKSMSLLTQALLRNINYNECKNQRIKNFAFLNDKLFLANELTIAFQEDMPAMVYPLLISKEGIKTKLIEEKIFVPTYWPNVFEWATEDTFEYKLAKNTICLPVDQRYNLNDMAYMVDFIKKII